MEHHLNCHRRFRFKAAGLALACLAVVPVACAAESAAPRHFDFGAGPAAAGRVKIAAGAAYSNETGYGFETKLGATPSQLDWGVTGAQPFYFSVGLPEGNYRVTAGLGDSTGGCVTTVKAETRRLMIERAATAAGERKSVTFAVNIRTFRLPPPPQNAPGGDQVRLNDREHWEAVLHWDDKLTLEFSDSRPCLDSLDIENAPGIPTVFIAGDSTVTDQPGEPTASWGQMFTRFFTPDVAIANHAESGETLKSFITGLRLDKVLSQMKKGDYFFIEFGHNDMKVNWPQTYVEPFTTHKQYLKVFIAEARRRGAVPVLVTPMQRRNFDGGKIRNSLGDFPESVRQTAKEENVALIDLTRMSIEFYEALGPEKAPLAFSGGRDATHHSDYGAYELAKCIVEGVRANKLDLARYILPDYKPFDPVHPDPPEAFDVPASPRIARMPPRGN
ncbi:MAG TPA: rhamnogalacturonan acetylesterase [Bryobacteraceae bacterium]|nr:rhamnogalacturonan acetylesterase [Bryobacteraceae bacterium]